MIADERISEYLLALEPEMPDYLVKLEQKAKADEVPIIRKDAQALLRFLLRMKRPARILEIGTAVGFSCLYMSEYMPEEALIATIEKVPMRIRPAKENFVSAPGCGRIALLVGDAAQVLRTLAEERVLAENRSFPVKDEGTESPERKMESAIFREASGKMQDPEKKAERLEEIFLPAGDKSAWNGQALSEQYDFIFMDAAKGQYMNFLPNILQLLSPEGIFVTDNVLQEGSLADSKFAITRRDRTIHKRMRDYLFELTHNDRLNTTVLPVGDGMTITTFMK